MAYKTGDRETYLETTDRRTHKILHIKTVNGCCMRCAIRQRRTWYHIWNRGGKSSLKFPNWKLVSKNKKQWMKKPLKFKPSKNWYNNYTSIEW